MNEPLTPEQYTQLLMLGGQNEDLDAQIRRQEAQAAHLRAGARPEMRGNGRIQTAPHWLELAGGLAREYAGNKQLKQADASGKQRSANSSLQNQMILQGILRGQWPPKAMDAQSYGGGM